MPDAGDTQIATLTVTPFDGSTLTTLTVTAPDGTTTAPIAATDNNGATWTATVPYTVAGLYTLTWTVTGTGAGVQQQTVSVAPLLPGAGRSYATTTDLANWMKAAPPLNSQALLEGATRFLDNNVLLTSVYDVDELGMPTDADDIVSLRDATCALAKWWNTKGITGEDSDSEYTTVSIGSATLTKTPGASPDPRVSREALEILAGAAFLGHFPRTC